MWHALLLWCLQAAAREGSVIEQQAVQVAGAALQQGVFKVGVGHCSVELLSRHRQGLCSTAAK